ncbi:hypothetical protein FB567DRAFT_545313 [Paraphoma chrysanthemicola]|uniref:Uncharacterized protein n=1 Tax=Paraphoma chrysanthemicola TaxID=798071 RepID=A0A8K0RBA9_9PLEO|nr:hypothetical protein FB567DRAFT_545313 [Paraphoma chrysanthemicola]
MAATSIEESNTLMARVKKALASCRRHTWLSSSKTRSSIHTDIGLHSMSSGTSSLSRRRTRKQRPSLLVLPREESSGTHSSTFKESNYSDDNDPFITSPSWFKAEFSREETGR